MLPAEPRAYLRKAHLFGLIPPPEQMERPQEANR